MSLRSGSSCSGVVTRGQARERLRNSWGAMDDTFSDSERSRRRKQRLEEQRKEEQRKHKAIKCELAATFQNEVKSKKRPAVVNAEQVGKRVRRGKMEANPPGSSFSVKTLRSGKTFGRSEEMSSSVTSTHTSKGGNGRGQTPHVETVARQTPHMEGVADLVFYYTRMDKPNVSESSDSHEDLSTEEEMEWVRPRSFDKGTSKWSQNDISQGRGGSNVTGGSIVGSNKQQTSANRRQDGGACESDRKRYVNDEEDAAKPPNGGPRYYSIDAGVIRTNECTESVKRSRDRMKTSASVSCADPKVSDASITIDKQRRSRHKKAEGSRLDSSSLIKTRRNDASVGSGRGERIREVAEVLIGKPNELCVKEEPLVCSGVRSGVDSDASRNGNSDISTSCQTVVSTSRIDSKLRNDNNGSESRRQSSRIKKRMASNGENSCADRSLASCGSSIKSAGRRTTTVSTNTSCKGMKDNGTSSPDGVFRMFVDCNFDGNCALDDNARCCYSGPFPYLRYEYISDPHHHPPFQEVWVLCPEYLHFMGNETTEIVCNVQKNIANYFQKVRSLMSKKDDHAVCRGGSLPSTTGPIKHPLFFEHFPYILPQAGFPCAASLQNLSAVEEDMADSQGSGMDDTRSTRSSSSPLLSLGFPSFRHFLPLLLPCLLPYAPPRLMAPISTPPSLFKFLRLARIGSGLSVRPSSIQGAGRGLFADRPFSAGEKITLFQGKVISNEQADRLSRKGLGGHLCSLRDGSRRVINSRKLRAVVGVWGGSFANDCTKTVVRKAVCVSSPASSVCGKKTELKKSQTMEPRANNARIKWKSAGDMWGGMEVIFIEATRKINAGDEIFVNYGKTYRIASVDDNVYNKQS